jgi:nitrogen-specific signal transduction histidine kinase
MQGGGTAGLVVTDADGSLRVASRRGHTEFTLELPGAAATAVRA